MGRVYLKFALCGVAFAVLMFLFANTKATDQRANAQVIDDLRIVKQQDARLTEEALELRYSLLTNYDPIVATSSALSTSADRLSREIRGMYRPGEQPGIDRALDRYLSSLAVKQQMVEDFKTENAVLKNSIAYLPALSDEFTRDRDPGSWPIDQLVRTVLIYNVSPNSETRSRISSLMADVRRIAGGYPPDKRAGLKLLMAHAHLISERRTTANGLLTGLVSAPTTVLGDRLFNDYQRYYGAIEYRRSVFTALLNGLAGLLAVVIAAMLYVLHRNGQVRLSEALARADTDPLTGLLNHRALHRRIAQEIDRAHRDGATVAVGVVDLDNFKFFNDSYGHAVGDGVLCEIANALTTSCRSYDILSRFGGDEFAFVMPGVGLQEASSVIVRIKDELERRGYRPPGYDNAIPITISIGLAMFPDDGQSRQEVLEVADRRLRQAKLDESVNPHAEDLRLLVSDKVEGFPMLMALVAAVDNKDRYTRRHSEDVMTYSVEIARELGLDEAMIHTIKIAALLHDVGKIGVPDYILRKPDKLSPEEFEAVKQHPVMGAVIVAAIPGLETTLDAIRHHHERWDGRGYPAGLAHKETPLIARLMAVADAYSAMTTDRPYRKGMASDVALGIIAQGAGTQWDPDCVEAFVNVRSRAACHPALDHPDMPVRGWRHGCHLRQAA